MNDLTLTNILHYEIHASCWAGWISHPKLQDLVGSYFAWKIGRKYRRYLRRMEIIEIQDRLIKKGLYPEL